MCRDDAGRFPGVAFRARKTRGNRHTQGKKKRDKERNKQRETETKIEEEVYIPVLCRRRRGFIPNDEAGLLFAVLICMTLCGERSASFEFCGVRVRKRRSWRGKRREETEKEQWKEKVAKSEKEKERKTKERKREREAEERVKSARRTVNLKRNPASV